ncbi:hypothetical protein [Streptomyces sp. NPDC003480]
MGDFARLTLPEDVADDLVSDRTAVRPITTRGGGFAETVAVTVDAINTGSAAVSVAVAAHTCRRLAQAFVRRRRQANHPSRVTLSVTVGGRTESMTIDLAEPQAEEQLFDFFAAQLHAV